MFAKLLFYAVFIMVFPVLYAKVLSRLKLRMGDKEFHERFKEYDNREPPKHYKVYWTAIVIGYIVIILAGTFVGVWGFSALQKNIISTHPPPILFVTSGLSYFIFSFTGLMLAVCLGALLMQTIVQISPRFWRFTQWQNMKTSRARPMPPKQSMAMLLKMTKMVCLFFLPLVLLALFSYHYVHAEGVVYNKFFSLSEQRRGWHDVQKVKVTANWARQSTPSLNYKYILEFDDAELNLWGINFLDHALRIHELLKLHDIPFEVQTLDAGKLQSIKKRNRNNAPVIFELFEN